MGTIQALAAKHAKPIKIIASGVNTDIRRLLVKRKAYNWLMSFSKNPVEKVVDSDNIVYLTDDAEEEFKRFDPTWDY